MEYTVGGKSSQGFHCALWSSNWYGAWCYGVARERLSSFLAVRAFSSSQHHEAAIRACGLSRFQEIQKDHTFTIPKISAHHFTHWRLSWTTYLMGMHMSSLNTLLFWCQLIMVTLHPVIPTDVIQESVTFSLMLVPQVLKNLHMVFILFLCEDLLDSPARNFALFQHCHHHF